MASTIALIALRALNYGGRSLGVGDQFEARPIDAAILTYRHHADFAPRASRPSTPSPHPAPLPIVITEPDEQEPISEPDEPAPEDPPKPRRRTYRRRDMKAED